jgi:hypothetical protein
MVHTGVLHPRSAFPESSPNKDRIKGQYCMHGWDIASSRTLVDITRLMEESLP